MLQSLRNLKATSGQHLVGHLTCSANLLGCNLLVRWISSHSKELAKEAANGSAIARVYLPQLLKMPVPVSASAIRQAFHGKLKNKWVDTLEESERRRRMGEIDEDFPYNKFRKPSYTSTLSRNQASLMTQIRSSHVPLNSYLNKINRSDTYLCQACLEEDDLHCRETVKHFLFKCPAYRQEREELVGTIGRSHLSTDRMLALVRFIHVTGRLKKD